MKKWLKHRKFRQILQQINDKFWQFVSLQLIISTLKHISFTAGVHSGGIQRKCNLFLCLTLLSGEESMRCQKTLKISWFQDWKVVVFAYKLTKQLISQNVHNYWHTLDMFMSQKLSFESDSKSYDVNLEKEIFEKILKKYYYFDITL